MSLELNSLQNGIKSLERAINVYEKEGKTHAETTDLMLTLQAGVIQNFEFTYELSWKFIKRWLEENISTVAVDGVTRRELFRQGAENKLIVDVEKWMDFHKSRNFTSHIYDLAIAKEVFASSTEFLPYAKELLKRLEERNT